MDRLLIDLLAFSHLSQEEIELTPLALKGVVESAVESCETEISESEAQVELCPPWPVVLAHGSTLRQVLVNLIGNAVKFVDAGAPQIRLRAETRDGGFVRIWVEDNGIGIPEEFQQRIFEVFERLHTTAYDGTGIGLAIVQKGVERMGGHVGVISTEGKGSRFWVDLAEAPAAMPATQTGKGADVA